MFTEPGHQMVNGAVKEVRTPPQVGNQFKRAQLCALLSSCLNRATISGCAPRISRILRSEGWRMVSKAALRSMNPLRERDSER